MGTKSMVVASVSGDHKVIGTDRTIALANAAAAASEVQIINKLNDRDKRPALQVTMTATDTVGVVAANKLTCSTDSCNSFEVNDVVRVHSVMKNGENQPDMDGIHVVKVKAASDALLFHPIADAADLSAS